MCNNVSKIKFCTCDISNEKIPGIHYWELSRLIGLSESRIIGKIKFPSEDLGNDITRDSLLNILNSNSPFDFDYSPNENDTLRISTNTTEAHYNYFSLIFNSGKWKVGNNPSFISLKQTIANGIIIIQQ